MTSLLNSKARALVTQKIIANLSKINVSSGICRFNYRCFNNAVHDALMRKESKICMCFYLNGGWPIIHFINVTKDGNYIDNTLGKWSTQYEYYFIRFIDEEQFFEVYQIIDSYRKEVRSNLPFLVRLLSNQEF